MGTFSQRASAKKALISRAYAKSRPQITGNFGLDHPSARLCYAWEVDGEVTALLGGGTVDSPIAAVRASILASDFAAREDKRR